MPERPGGRRYPRMARVNELVREVVAEELERLQSIDERLGLMTVTHVEVEADLRRATVLLSTLTEEGKEALADHRVRLQAALGRQVRLRRTPQLSFAADPAIESGRRVEDILRRLAGSSGEPGSPD